MNLLHTYIDQEVMYAIILSITMLVPLFYLIILFIQCVKSQYKILTLGGEICQTIEPTYAWSQFIPGLNFVFAYLLSWHVSKTIMVWEDERPTKTSALIRSLGIRSCNAGMMFVLCLILSGLVSYFFLTLEFMVLIYWIQSLYRYNSRMKDIIILMKQNK